MATDQTTVHQAACKVAAELVAATQPRTIDDALSAYDKAFTHVLNSINFANNTKEVKKTKGGRQVPIISQDEIQMRLNQKLAGTAVTTNLVQF